MSYFEKKIFTAILAALAINATIYAQKDSAINKVPFDGMDLSWVNGNSRVKNSLLVLTDNKTGEAILTGTAYIDTYYNYNFANPIDNTQTISSTIGRCNEVSVNLASFGIETNYKNILGHLSMQAGSMLNIIQDADGSVYRGRNAGTNNLKYIREARAGYHFNKWYGINIEAGIFMSYIGLESYMLQDNWNYQRSMVSDFTPFYFQGARLQLFPSKKFKTELWLINGWQSYNSFSNSPSLGSSSYWIPTENMQLSANFYLGRDTQNPDTSGHQSNRIRFHHDNSILYRYYKKPNAKSISQAAFSINTHYGFQNNNEAGDIVKANQNFIAGTALSSRIWFDKNKMALTLRGDAVLNQSVVNGVNVFPYLSFTPAAAGGIPNNFDYAIANNEKLKLFQFTATFDVMPNDYVTFRFEYSYRESNIPYFTGAGGTTSASGWTNGPTPMLPWAADLKKIENRITVAVNFRL